MKTVMIKCCGMSFNKDTWRKLTTGRPFDGSNDVGTVTDIRKNDDGTITIDCEKCSLTKNKDEWKDLKEYKQRDK